MLVGRLHAGRLVYESVNACIRFVGSLDGCHIVTIEHLKGADGRLHPVQQAMVDFHGSQCGFCTPGFVMSLYALWMRSPEPGDAEIEKALQGNLCRCTGYEAIVRAARAISTYGKAAKDPLAVERKAIVARLQALKDGARVEIGHDGKRLVVPADADDFARVLAAEPQATVVAGSTDVGLWVTKFMRDISPVVFIGGIDELKSIGEDAGSITIGAGVTYTEAFVALSKRIPALGPLFDRIGGEQVRNMGTIGGNIANGSPIGDTPPPLIALGATLTLRKGGKRRDDPARGFLHRLRQAGPPAGRVRRGGARSGAGEGRPFRSLQDHKAPRRGHHLDTGRLSPEIGERRHGVGNPHRVWWHGGDAEAGRPPSRVRCSASHGTRRRWRPRWPPTRPISRR